MVIAFIIKVICTLLIIYAVCMAVTSPLKSNKARSIVATLAFIPMGLIAVISFAESLNASHGKDKATVALWAGIAAVLLSVCLTSKFGRTVLANVIGNAVYDLFKNAIRILVAAPNMIRKRFR